MATIKDITALLPNAQTACNLFLAKCAEQGLKVRITETYRSQARQNELYAQGRTKPGNIVTWTKSSRHTSRRAWDICQDIKGKEYDTSTGFFDKCGVIAESLGITWGGKWSTPDKPHFEVSEYWQKPKSIIEEEREMEELRRQIKELTKQVELLSQQAPKVYRYTKDVPAWGRPTVQKLMNKGIYSGAAADDLNLSEDMLRIFVINDRAGLYD